MSDWALGKKLNSQIADVPLNHLIWLNDYKTYGENSYVFNNKDILHELYRSPISANDSWIRTAAFDYNLYSSKDFGAFVSNIYGSEKVEAETFSDVANNTAVLDKLWGNSGFVDAIISNEQAIKDILNGTYINNIIENNKTEFATPLSRRIFAETYMTEMLAGTGTIFDWLIKPYLTKTTLTLNGFSKTFNTKAVLCKWDMTYCEVLYSGSWGTYFRSGISVTTESGESKTLSSPYLGKSHPGAASGSHDEFVKNITIPAVDSYVTNQRDMHAGSITYCSFD